MSLWILQRWGLYKKGVSCERAVFPVTPQGLHTHCHFPAPKVIWILLSQSIWPILPISTPRVVFAGPRAACVAPALKMARSVSTCTRLPPSVCVTPQVTGLQRRPWVKDHGFFIYTLVATENGGGGKGWSGGSENKAVCVCVCVCVHGLLENSRDLQVTGWDLCADGPPVLKVVVAVLSQRTDGGPREENSGDDFRMSWLQHIMLFVPASPWNSLATGWRKLISSLPLSGNTYAHLLSQPGWGWGGLGVPNSSFSSMLFYESINLWCWLCFGCDLS